MIKRFFMTSMPLKTLKGRFSKRQTRIVTIGYDSTRKILGLLRWKLFVDKHPLMYLPSSLIHYNYCYTT